MALKSLTRKQRRRKKILRFVAVFFLLGILIFLAYGSFFNITGLSIQGAKHTNITLIEEDLQPMISGYRYGIVPNNNIFLYQKKNIENFILQKYPSVEIVKIKLDFHKKIIIDIKDRKPLGVWCSDECYLYDTEGVIFKKSFLYKGPLYVSWKNEVNIPINLLDTVSCQGLCTDITFADFLREYRIEKAVIYDNMIELNSADGYIIKSSFSASTTISHMRDVVENKPDILKNLEYIDMRFESKVFYKEREE